MYCRKKPSHPGVIITSEFAVVSSVLNGSLRVNPFDIKKSAAGSSGGSAAALACDMLPLANGSDYGGSLRTPSGFCGVSGFRPSPGIVPTVDSSICLNPFSVQGPMGKNVIDTFLLLQAQADINCNDPFSSFNSYSCSGIITLAIRKAYSVFL